MSKFSDDTDTERSVRKILEVLTDDVHREGLRDTPKRYISFLNEFLTEKPLNLTTFDAEGYDQLMLQSEIPFFSLCEHHLVPFFGKAWIGYIPNGRLVGISKLSRVLDKYSKRLQNQERITTQVLDFLQENLNPRGVGVVIKARHLCVEMRGVEKFGTWTITSRFSGALLENAQQQQFLKLCSGLESGQ